ncbi:hypothetical protein PC110_g22772, partial [Phytophthora cactorum]
MAKSAGHCSTCRRELSRGSFTVVPPRSNETSFIFNWGVRVKYEENGKNVVEWACLADEGCRTSGTKLIKLHAGKTTLAVKYLQKLHHIASPKTTVANENKRKFEEDTDHFKSSVMYRNNPGRLRLLLTAQMIVNRNLPFRVVEYEEAKLMNALLCKEEMKANITTPRVNEAIVELYSSTKMEVTNYLDGNKEAYPTFTLVADFWTCKTTSDKFLEARVYLVDREWQFKSVLLGTRKFNPAYGDRDGDIQKLFKAWLDNMLNGFGLERQHFYGATSDHGGDVRSMLKNGMNLHWEWCFAHMAHAATKASCGVNGAVSARANPEMADLVVRMVRVIFQVKHVSAAGNLFQERCKTKTKGASTRLVGYSTSHFLSLTNVLNRVIEKWPAITAWFEERGRQDLRARKSPPEFPLANQYDELVNTLSVLKQMGGIERSCQAERPEQVEVLAQL